MGRPACLVCLPFATAVCFVEPFEHFLRRERDGGAHAQHGEIGVADPDGVGHVLCEHAQQREREGDQYNAEKAEGP